MLRYSAVATIVLLAGCASVPQPLRGEFSATQPGAAIGTTDSVRWGGRVIEVLSTNDESCVEVVGLPLDRSARPLDNDDEIGRFRACKPGFLDPAIFAPGREVTVTGRVDGEVTRQLGEYTYRMPRVVADSVLLWPERIDAVHVHQDPFYWGPGWWPVRPIIVVPSPRRR